MRRVVGPAVLSLGLMLLIASPVVAAPPDREPYLALPPVIVDSSCRFDVTVTFPVNQEFITSFYDKDGNPVRQTVTGRLVVTMEANGNSITANISGPTHIDFVNGGAIGHGRFGGPIPGEPGLWLGAGRQDLDSGERNGHFVNICSLLAP